MTFQGRVHKSLFIKAYFAWLYYIHGSTARYAFNGC